MTRRSLWGGGRVAWMLAIAIVALGTSTGALAQEAQPLGVDIRSAVVDPDGTTSIVVNVQGDAGVDLDSGAFTVTEAEEPVDGLDVRRTSEADEIPVRTVIVTLDTSGSTSGAPIRLAKEAVADFAMTVTDRDVAVGLVTFADTATLAVAPTTDPDAIIQAVDEVTAEGGTALYDAMVLSAEQLQDLSGQRSIVVFSDGADLDSTVDLATALRAVTTVGAQVSAVGLQTETFDPVPLEILAEATGGEVLEVDTAEQLQAAFESVAQSFTSQYVVTYPNTGRTGQFDVQVIVSSDGATAVDTVPVLSPLSQAGTAPPAATSTVGAPNPFQRPTAGWVALVALAIGVLVLVAGLLISPGDKAALANLRASMGPGDDDTDQPSPDLTAATAVLSRQAVQLIERVPKPSGYDRALQQRLDRASWPLRAAEFTTIRGISALVTFGLVWALAGSFLVALLAGAAGWFVPDVALTNRVNARHDAFMAQLPDTLQLLAGSLRAGYGVLQAIDTVVAESREPTRSEFQRVVTESRLGMALEDSLTAMAERIGTEDFRWVAVAINIQRRVGGNLSSLLETVADTLRERSTTRRQVKALSAEGRISAIILTAMPIVLAIYMFIVNPDYLGILFTDPRGLLMVVGGVLAMIAGIVWMRTLVQIDV